MSQKSVLEMEEDFQNSTMIPMSMEQVDLNTHKADVINSTGALSETVVKVEETVEPKDLSSVSLMENDNTGISAIKLEPDWNPEQVSEQFSENTFLDKQNQLDHNLLLKIKKELNEDNKEGLLGINLNTSMDFSTEQLPVTATTDTEFVGWKIKDEEVVLKEENVAQDNRGSKHANIPHRKEINGVKTFECDKCDFKTIYKCNLKTHQLQHKNPEEMTLFKCDECAYQTFRKDNLHNHILRHKNLKEGNTLKCNNCDYRTIDKGSLKRHQLGKKSMCSGVNFLSLSGIATDGIDHVKPDEDKKHKCNFCDYQTNNSSHLNKHLLHHKNIDEVEKFECDKCDFKTIYKWSLKSHQLQHKNREEMNVFKCDQCAYQTFRNDNLQYHILRHKNLKEGNIFKCNDCEYQTVDKGSLNRHQLRHKDPGEVMLFRCVMCDFETIYKTSFKKHNDRHANSAKKNYIIKCSQCEYVALTKHSLQKHRLMHKNVEEVAIYKCNQCNYENSHIRNLRRHQLRHKDINEVETLSSFIVSHSEGNFKKM